MKNNSQLEEFIQLHMLRRTKSEVGIHLPPLQINNTNVAWKSDVERKLNLKFMEHQRKARRYSNYDIDSDDSVHNNNIVHNDDSVHSDNSDNSDDEITFQVNEIQVSSNLYFQNENKTNNIFSILEQRKLGMPCANRNLHAHYRSTHLIDEDIDKCAELLENNLLTSMIRGRQMCIYPY